MALIIIDLVTSYGMTVEDSYSERPFTSKSFIVSPESLPLFSTSFLVGDRSDIASRIFMQKRRRLQFMGGVVFADESDLPEPTIDLRLEPEDKKVLASNASYAEFMKFLKTTQQWDPIQDMPTYEETDSMTQKEQSDSFKKFLTNLTDSDIEQFLCEHFQIEVELIKGKKAENLIELTCNATQV